jgi:hypothetical protein
MYNDFFLVQTEVGHIDTLKLLKLSMSWNKKSLINVNIAPRTAVE